MSELRLSRENLYPDRRDLHLRAVVMNDFMPMFIGVIEAAWYAKIPVIIYENDGSNYHNILR